ncbi:MAG: zinc ribbon domain-containing protein [Defluviitaleaceae bacterium]|nr:zinc ribbon domain-containing protein [Defluviitaleaceae bacterium]
MLNSLIRGVSMGAGMGIGQQITGTLIQHVVGRTTGQRGNNGNNSGNTGHSPPPAATGWDIQCACGESNTGDSRFCGQCGKPLVARCTLSSGTRCACGFMNATGQKFCSECGNRL